MAYDSLRFLISTAPCGANQVAALNSYGQEEHHATHARNIRSIELAGARNGTGI